MALYIKMIKFNVREGMIQPLEQFSINIITRILGLDINTFLIYLFIISVVIFFFYFFPLFFYKITPNILQQNINFIYDFFLRLFCQQIVDLTALRYFQLIFSVFIIILTSNLLGLVPFGFTLTSHIYITAFFSISLFIGITIVGFLNNQYKFINFFIPGGVTNKFLLYYLVCIEVFSYLIRPFSLGIRLFANMLAGHTLLFILSGFVIQVSKKKVVFLVFLPLLAIVFVVFLEIAIAFIQSYVFNILLIIYLNDIYSIKDH